MIHSSVKLKDQVRTTLAIGTRLPKGSVGVVVEITDQYEGLGGKERPILSVIFPQLAMPAGHGADIEGLNMDSLPPTNAVPLRISEVEVIQSLDTGGGA